MTRPVVVAVVSWRDPSDSGIFRTCREFVDRGEADRFALSAAEVFGEVQIHVVRESHVVQHSRAVPHGQPARDPEVIR